MYSFLCAIRLQNPLLLKCCELNNENCKKYGCVLLKIVHTSQKATSQNYPGIELLENMFHEAITIKRTYEDVNNHLNGWY